MEKKLILRGALAGALAGLLAFVFARIFAEPQISKAIDYESGREAAQQALDKAVGLSVAEHSHDVFSRTVQADFGSGAGLIGFGLAMGALFAVAYLVCIGRVGNLRPRSLSLFLAAGGLLGVYLVPFVKYPANPPSVGHEATIRDRTDLYLVMVIGSVLFLSLAVWLGQRLKPRFGNWNASLLAGGGFVVAIGVLMFILPSVGHLSANTAEYGNLATETPQPLRDGQGNIVYPGFPADVLYQFRFFSIGAQLVLWAALGLIFAPLAERVLQPGTVRQKPVPQTV